MLLVAVAVAAFVWGMVAVLLWQEREAVADYLAAPPLGRSALVSTPTMRFADKARDVGLPVFLVERNHFYVCAWDRPDPTAFPFLLMPVGWKRDGPPGGLAKATLFDSGADAREHDGRHEARPWHQVRGRWMFHGDPDYVKVLCGLCEPQPGKACGKAVVCPTGR